MAVRLQMKLGVVAEQDRLPDSPDTVVVVEPSVGSVARSKGHLYLLVTSQVTGRHVQEATRLAAETIRNEYYYDESAGIRVCIEKAVAAANKRLAHQRDRLGLGRGDNGPIGVGIAVVRGNELYVATVGPAEAYLIRQARLSTLPDPHRERGLPSTGIEPEVWRGEIAVGDSLVLISPNVMARLGADELKDAMVTLHPQSAMEHLHHRFVAADGVGSDGAIAFEATEVAATHKQRTLVPVRPAEPLAGAPDRSPIPLADGVVGGVAAVQAGAERARTVAGSALERAVVRFQDLVLPRRRTVHRRVTPVSARRETQRRAAVALLAFIVVATGLGMGIYVLAGQQPRTPISSITAGERALKTIRDDLAKVFAPGVDLVEAEPDQAMTLLTEAYQQLDAAEKAQVSAATLRPLRSEIVAGLDRLYKMRTVGKVALFAFPPGEVATDLGAIVDGPDGAPYVLDRATKAVYRVDVKAGKPAAIFRAGAKAAGATEGTPRFINRAGPDVLILDDKNVLWRWRPANDKGKGTIVRVRVNGAASWGDDVRDIGTYVRNADAGLYNLYVVDPSEQQILAYSPAADGSGYPNRPTNRLAAPRDVAHMTSLLIDGDIFVVENGVLERFVAGKSDGWDATPPGDELLRKAPAYTLMTSGTARRTGRLYGYDPANRRIVAFDKAAGTFVEQYRLPAGDQGWAALRGMFVRPGADEEPDVLVWISADTIYQTILEPIPGTPGASPSAEPSPSASASASAAPPASAKPTKKP